uniref:Ig-like domain-containing protein n=1 Tax=Schistosoma mansoni TaxID=6183 RepID=A0A5K4F3K1_SCHMA
MQTNVFNPITKELDLPIGKLLEIQVKIDEETVWKLMNNSKENIQVNWYQNSTLIEPSSTCEMLKINDRFILRSTTNHLQPDKLYNYTCILRLPENSSMSPAPSITIPVSFHCPTVKELETEFKNCIDKNKVTVENNPVFEVELEEDDAFQLKIPIQNGSQNQDFVVWWTHEDELLTGNHLTSNEREYNCSFELNKQSNEMMTKLSKTSTGTTDSGIYKCWTVSQSLKDNAVQCTNVRVKVRQEEARQSEKLNDKEKEEGEKLQEDKISMIDGVETNHLSKKDVEINKEVPSMKKEEEEDLKKRGSDVMKRKEEIVRLKQDEEETPKKQVEEKGKDREEEEEAEMKRNEEEKAESTRGEKVESKRKEEETVKKEEEVERKRKEEEKAESTRGEKLKRNEKKKKLSRRKKKLKGNVKRKKKLRAYKEKN